MSGRVFDVLIRNGIVVDGTGSPGYRAAVGVNGDRLSIIRGDTSETVVEIDVDAQGMVVAPGFIDCHTHSDLLVLEDEDMEMKVRQGVTSEIVGVDGLSYAPFDENDDLQRFARSNSGIGGLPRESLGFSTIGEYLELAEGSEVNVGTFAGNTALRVNAVGWGNVPASGQAVTEMRAKLREAMAEGALGLSTGLDYPPGSFASTEELVELAREVASAGGVYHTHVRYSLGDAFLDPFREAFEIGRWSGAPVHVTHLSRSARATHTLGAQRILDLFEQAHERGEDVTFDAYPYEFGGTRLVRLLPEWVQEDGRDALEERLAERGTRDRLRTEIPVSAAVLAYGAGPPFWDVRLGNLTHADDVDAEGAYLATVVAERGGSLPDVLCDLVAKNEAAVFCRPSAHAMTLWKFIVHPLGMVASDSLLLGRYPSPRGYGSFARILADFVREERLLSLPEAVRKMTSFPAMRFGLTDRGILRDGAVADVAVFDHDAVTAPASYEHPRVLATGMHHVLVSGQFVLRDGKLTGARPGKALRRALVTRAPQ